MRDTRWTARWSRGLLAAIFLAIVLLSATSCGLFPKQPTTAKPPVAPPPTTQPPQQPPAQPPVVKPPENPPAPGILAEGKPAPAFELQALNSTGTVRFPEAFKGKVVALEFFSTG